ncbi:MrcB family domain-containing protein [Streptomyces sp. NPDC002536]
MEIRELLKEIAETYDKDLGTGGGVHAQDLLRAVRQQLMLGVSDELTAKGYGGNGDAGHTPWIGIFDLKVTKDPKKGLYLAYIFAADLKTVTLTLQQGVTRLAKSYGQGQKLRDYLTARADALSGELPPAALAGWQVRPDFKSETFRALAYEAGSVAARRYSTDSLPEEAALRADLEHLAHVLRQAHAVEAGVTVKDEPAGFEAGYKPAEYVEYKALEGFAPKDSSDYEAHIVARTVKKTRKHELLIDQFGRAVAQRGFDAVTKGQHPKDLVLRKDGAEWLVEAKAIKRHSATLAVREALAQLYEYNHFLCSESKPHLLALFDEEITTFVSYLEGLGIGSVWKTLTGWAGSPSAVKWGLVD